MRHRRARPGRLQRPRRRGPGQTLRSLGRRCAVDPVVRRRRSAAGTVRGSAGVVLRGSGPVGPALCPARRGGDIIRSRGSNAHGCPRSARGRGRRSRSDTCGLGGSRARRRRRRFSADLPLDPLAALLCRSSDSSMDGNRTAVLQRSVGSMSRVSSPTRSAPLRRLSRWSASKGRCWLSAETTTRCGRVPSSLAWWLQGGTTTAWPPRSSPIPVQATAPPFRVSHRSLPDSRWLAGGLLAPTQSWGRVPGRWWRRPCV